MSEFFLPPVKQLINVDLFNALQESDVGQFGPDYTNLERYKQAGEYALEAQMYAQMAEDYGNQTVQKVQQIIENAGDAGTLFTLALDSGASKIGTFSGKTVQEEIDLLKNTAITPEKFGAKGDGITDDTFAIQQALNWVTAKSFRKLIFSPDKKYYISSPLVATFQPSVIFCEIDMQGVLYPSAEVGNALTIREGSYSDFKLKVIEVIVPIKIVEKTKMIIKLYALGRRLSGEVAIAKSRILKNGLVRAIKLP